MKQVIAYFRVHKHRLATVALVVGFIVDIITFRNLNLSFALMLLAAHLAIVAGSIITLATPSRTQQGSLFGKVRSWLPVVQQYSMGNLLSAFLILYSASSSLAASWPFLALVAIAAIGNESLKLQKYRLPFETSLFLLNLALYAALIVPVLLGSISAVVFLAALIVSVFAFALFKQALSFAARNAFKESKKHINQGAMLIVGLLALLYFTNLMPPIPLIAKDIGFYHAVSRSGNAYIAQDEARDLFEQYFTFTPHTLHLAPGEDAYVYTAVFAPARLDTEIQHRWQFFDEREKRWRTQNIVPFPIMGGREGGYRGFSLAENPKEGRWRVSVETARGQTIGRAYFSVIRTAFPVPIDTVELR